MTDKEDTLKPMTVAEAIESLQGETTEEATGQAQVIDFSFQMKDFDDESLTLKETYLQFRFYAIELINLVVAGKTKLRPEDKKSIRIYNRYCKIAGLEPLEGKI